jgi:hypothetical protein
MSYKYTAKSAALAVFFRIALCHVYVGRNPGDALSVL